MQLHQIKPTNKPIKSKRVGRGGKKGFYCGKGNKGQTSRAGRKYHPLIRQIIKRYPKLRGYKFGPQDKPAVLNIEILDKIFEKGQIVNPKILIGKRIIRRIGGRIPDIKILGTGKTTKAFILEGFKISKQAKDKIEKAGGQIK